MTDQPTPSECLNDACTKGCTSECRAVIQSAWESIRRAHHLTAAPVDPEMARLAEERAARCAADSARSAAWFAAQRTDAGLRKQYAQEIHAAGPMEINGAETIADAVLAVRDREMEQLRGDLDRVQQRACRTAESLRTAEGANATHRALLEEARDTLEAAGINEAHGGDSWPRLAPAIEELATRAEQAEAARDEAIVRAEYAEATVERVRQAAAKGAPLESFMGDEPTEYAHGWAAATALIDDALDQPPGFVCGEPSTPPVAAIERVKNECDAIVAEVYGQHDEDDDGMREAVRRIRAVLGIPTDEPQPDPRCRAALAALAQPQQPTA